MAADAPPPPAPLAPDLTIVESRVYRGPQHLVLRAGDPPRRRPRRPRGLPHRHPARVHRPARRAAARAETARLLPGPRRRLRRAAARGHLAGPRRRARRAPAAAGGRPRPVARQDPRRQGPARASTTSSTATPTRRSASPPAGSRCGSSTTSSQHEEGFDFARGARRLPPARAERTAFGPSTAAILEEAVSRDIPCIRLNSGSPRAARAGRAPAADPRHDDVEDRGAGRRHRRRQGPHHQAARLGRAPGAQAGVGAHRPTGRWPPRERIGYPVVVKPLDGNHGRGVCLDLQSTGEVRRRPSTSPRASRSAARSSSSRS